MVIVQGEKFRPTGIENIVDDTILSFIEGLKKITPERLEKFKKKTIEDLHEFPNSLSDVADRYISSVEEQILGESTEDYTEIAKQITVDFLSNLAKKVFVEKPERITIELFANEVGKDEITFMEKADALLDKKTYKLVQLQDLLEQAN